MKITNKSQNIFDNNIIFYNKKNIKKKNELIFLIENGKKLLGQFSFVCEHGKYTYIGRDNLGTKKLFFTAYKKKIYTSKNFIDLSKKKYFLHENIFSCSKGTVLKFEKDRLIKIFDISPKMVFYQKKKNNLNDINQKLNFLFKELKKKYSKVVVALSGGLDSAIILDKAKKHFQSNTYAATCSLKKNIKSKLTEDMIHAENISKKLKVKHIKILFSEKFVIKNLNNILFTSQDWRDYNVHCAVINYALGQRLKKIIDLKKTVLITGDFMNEYFADYEEEKFEGVTYYKQLQASQKIRQRFFIKGLDSSAREVSVFEYFGIQNFQPYFIVKSNYESLKEKELNFKNAKYDYNKYLINDKLYKLINSKKIRAQSDPFSGGILGIFHSNRISSKELENRFKKNFNLSDKFIKNFINVGSYKSFDIESNIKTRCVV